ncbi:hypothetical protein ACFSC4_03525 [Deinococcus malanensis]|uniref:hypothetical protein n=1 Tax=Deinococcus malanensis TaxID=1706855 RepID=UPI0036317943
MLFILGLIQLLAFGLLGLGCWALVRWLTRSDPRAHAAVVVALFLPWIASLAYGFAASLEYRYVVRAGVDTSVGYKNVPVSPGCTLIARIPPDESFVVGPAKTDGEERPRLMYADELTVQGDRVYVRSAEGVGVIDRQADTWRRVPDAGDLQGARWLSPQAYNQAYGPQPGPLHPMYQAATRAAPLVVSAPTLIPPRLSLGIDRRDLSVPFQRRRAGCGRLRGHPLYGAYPSPPGPG